VGRATASGLAEYAIASRPRPEGRAGLLPAAGGLGCLAATASSRGADSHAGVRAAVAVALRLSAYGGLVRGPERLCGQAGADRDRACGALLGTFVGDALGMPFEGQPTAAIPAHLEMAEARLGRGTYTDDTQMMIALGESLLELDRIDQEHLARAFLDAFDPERGYGSATIELFQLWRQGVPSPDAASRLYGGAGSRGNGAAMRIAPIAVRFADSARRLRAEAERSARLTHAHPLAVDAAVVQATAVAAALHDEEVLSASREAANTAVMRNHLDDAAAVLASGCYPEEVGARLGNSPEGHRSVPTAIVAAISQPRFEEAVRFAVRCGGDTDTLGAMAGAIAGARHGASAIPQRWLDALEDSEKGRRHVAELAEALAGRRSAGASAP
jgi:poly(ADP-ribose) glycohydrolase ARH3